MRWRSRWKRRPSGPGRHYLDWPAAAPDRALSEAVRAIRDIIDTHITDALATLPTA